METLPRLVLTGASGFVGRRVLETVRSRYRVFAVDRLSQAESQAPDHPNVSWHQLDIAEPEPLSRFFTEVRAGGSVQVLLHLAAYYDFTGENHPEYQRTNIDGTCLLLEMSRGLGLERFIFASSAAACEFPRPGTALTESSPPDATHPYGISKRQGEELVREASRDFPTAIVRFAALFSDWCEYAPLFVFLQTWLSKRWNARVLGGRGRSAVPYMHVRDLALFLERVIDRRRDLPPNQVLLASPDGAVTHEELFRATTAYAFGKARRPLYVPKPLAAVGIRARHTMGKLLGEEPFERPWMSKMIDLRLDVDARRTRELLDWAPRPRLSILRRIPFLIENSKADPVEWYAKNADVLHLGHLYPNLQVLRLLDLHEPEISARFTRVLIGPEGQELLTHYREMPAEEHAWHHRLLFHNLLQAVRTRERGPFMSYCRDLAERRARQGFTCAEVRYAISAFDRIVHEVLAHDSASFLLRQAIHDYITVTLEFGIDAIEDVFELHHGSQATAPPEPAIERTA